MRRILIFTLLAAVLLSSCGASWWSIGPMTMTAPLYDNAAASCALPPVLMSVAANAPRVMHRRITQGAWACEDSISTTAGVLVSFPESLVPAATLCTVRGWASDLAGAGCDTTITRLPTLTLRPPARPAVVMP